MIARQGAMPAKIGDVMDHNGVRVVVVKFTDCSDCCFHEPVGSCDGPCLNWVVQEGCMFVTVEDICQ